MLWMRPKALAGDGSRRRSQGLRAAAGIDGGARRGPGRAGSDRRRAAARRIALSAGGSDETPRSPACRKCSRGSIATRLPRSGAESTKQPLSRSSRSTWCGWSGRSAFAGGTSGCSRSSGWSWISPVADFRSISVRAGRRFVVSRPRLDWRSLEAFRAAESLASHRSMPAGVASLHAASSRLPGRRAAPAVSIRGRIHADRSVLGAPVDCQGFWSHGDHLKTVHGWLAEQLERWPDDALAWIGDRAAGDGVLRGRPRRPVARLPRAERGRSPEIGGLFCRSSRTPSYATSIETSFTTWPRCARSSPVAGGPTMPGLPISTRCGGVAGETKRGGFSAACGTFLLPDIEKGHVIQARDRANCEAGPWRRPCRGRSATAPGGQSAYRPALPRRARGGTIMVLDIGAGEGGDNPPGSFPTCARIHRVSEGSDGTQKHATRFYPRTVRRRFARRRLRAGPAESRAGAKSAYAVYISRRGDGVRVRNRAQRRPIRRWNGAALDALDLVESLEAQPSYFRPESELPRINRQAGEQPVAVEPRLFELLEFAQEVYRQTQARST